MPPRSKSLKASEGIAPETVSETPKGKGRPTKFMPEYVAVSVKLYDKGWTDEEVADFFDVSVRTLYRWQVDHEDFCQAVKMGKESPDNRAERALFHRAVGFEWTEQQAIKVKETKYENGKRVAEMERVEVVDLKRKAPPDTTASIFWLKNRRKEDWRDKHEVDHIHRIDLSQLGDDELANIAAGGSYRVAETEGYTSKPH